MLNPATMVFGIFYFEMICPTTSLSHHQETGHGPEARRENSRRYRRRHRHRLCKREALAAEGARVFITGRR
jgi:hypothetical protein